MSHSSAQLVLRIPLCALLLAVSALADGRAEWSGRHARENDKHPPVYQRRAFEWMHGASGRHGYGRPRSGPPVSAGWFQRPYPYHLDYYRMRYGGSYAPYFGNLYGPPQVVTAPPYYGPYYDGYGYQNGFGPDGAYGYGAPVGHPHDANGPGFQPAEESNDRDLPARSP